MANEETIDVKVGQRPGYFVTFDGKEMKLPNGWAVLPPGDAGLTRRVKKAGPHWVVKDLYKKRWISKGVLALRETINSLGAELDAELIAELIAEPSR